MINRTDFQPELDGFAFTNQWNYEGEEQDILERAVAAVVPALEAVTLPIILATAGPLLALEIGILGPGAPFVIADEVRAINRTLTRAIANAIEAPGYGLCGGMAFAALDYYSRQWVVPRGSHRHDQPHRDHPQGAQLRDYIWSRLLRSVEDNASTFLQLMVTLHLSVGDGLAVLRDRTLQEWNVLKARIDRTRQPVPIGLIGTTWNPLNNHQVLATGYEDNGDGTGSLLFYDNNAPDVLCEDRLDFRGPHLVVAEDCQSQSSARGPLQAFFCTAYAPAVPPLAVVTSRRLSVSTRGCATSGGPVDASFGVRNVGYHSTVLLAPEVMASDGATALQLPGQVIPEGGDIGFEQPLRFSGAGSRRVATAVVASNLGKTAVKLVPNPDGSPAETVTIAVLPPPEIAPVVSDCTPWGVAGEVTEFQVRNRDAIGGALTYNWSSDAGIGSDPHQPTFRLELPAAVGQRVRISCSVSRPDGCVVEGGTTLVTVAPEAADFSRLICELAKSPGFRHLGRGKLVDQGDGYRTGEPIPLTEITGLRDLLAKAAEAANSVLTTEKVSVPVLTAQPSLATVAQPR